MGAIEHAQPGIINDDLTALFGAVSTLRDRFQHLSDAQRWILVEIAFRRSAELKAEFEQRIWPTT